MVAPVTGAQLRPLIPTSDDDLCAVLTKFQQFQGQLMILFDYIWDDDGEMSEDFKAQICADIKWYGGKTLPKCNLPNTPVPDCHVLTITV